MNLLRLSAHALPAAALLLAALGQAPHAAAAPAASPASYTVNSINDVAADFNSDPGFTTCRTNIANSTCTLRAAIMNANRHAGGGLIHLPAGDYVLNLPPVDANDDASGNLNISGTVTLLGAGAGASVVDGHQLDNVFRIENTGVFTASGLTIQGGASSTAGGGLYNLNQLALVDSLVRANHASIAGAGLINLGNATLTRVTLADNLSGASGAGLFSDGALTLTASTVSANRAAQDGGGVYNNDEGTLTLFDSTLSNNSAGGDGGGLVNFGAARLYHITLAGNLAGDLGVAGHQGGGLLNDAAATLQMWNSVLVNNFVGHGPSQCAGVLHSQGYNYLNLNGSCPLTGTTTGNIIVTQDPLLGELAANGGPTLTRAPAPGSLIVDQIPPAVCQDPFGTAPVPDQRGVLRPVGPQCDMGAYEGTLAPPIFGHNLLRNGDAEAGAGSPNGSWVGVPQWILLGSSQVTAANYNPTAGFPSVVTSTVPANHGANLFAGGNITTSAVFQIIAFDQAGINSLVDGGGVHYRLSASLGGFGSQNDNATVTLQFENIFGSAVGAPIVLLGPNAAGRGNATGLLPLSQSGLVPPQVRAAFITLSLTRTSGPGTYNDGYADDLSLVLTGSPAFLPVLIR